MLKVILSVLTAIIILVIGGLTWAYFSFVHTKALTTAELADLTPDWSLVTHNNWSPWFTTPEGTTIWSPAKSFNAWLETVPEEDKAWPLLLDAYFAHEELFEHADIGRSRWEADDWHGLVKLLEQPEHAQVVPDLLEALSKPVLGCGLYGSTDPVLHAKLIEYARDDPEWDPILRDDPDLLSVMLPMLGKQRRARKLLCSHAMMLIEQGEIDEALSIFEVVTDSVRHNEEYQSLIGQLVSIADRTLVYDLLLTHIIENTYRWNEPQLARVDAMLSPEHAVEIVWEAETMVMYDLIRRMGSSSGGLDYITAGKMLDSMDSTTYPPAPPAVSLPDDQLKPVLQRPMYFYHRGFTLLKNQSSIPWNEDVQGGYDYIITKFDSVNPIFKLLIEVLAPATDKAAARARHYNQQLHASRLLVAAHRARLRHGQFPDTIDAIDKDLLPTTPVDAFSDEPLKYRVVDTKHGPSLLIYSVGTDRDDDDGWPMRTYDISDLDDVESTRVKFEKLLPPIATSPHWITQSSVDEINAIDPNLIKGDWVLYPIPDDE